MNLREIWKEDTILDAGGNRSARRKPAWASMDREPNSHTTLTRLGIEPGPHWWKAREQPLCQPVVLDAPQQGLSWRPVHPSFSTGNCHLRQAQKCQFWTILHYFRPFWAFSDHFERALLSKTTGNFEILAKSLPLNLKAQWPSVHLCTGLETSVTELYVQSLYLEAVIQM